MPNSHNVQRIKSRRSYSLKEIGGLLGISGKTCSRWIRDGLKPIDPDAKPLLVMGVDLKKFLQEQRAKRKIPLTEDECLCLRCRAGRKIAAGAEKIVATGKLSRKTGQAQLEKVGPCEVCGTVMHRLLPLAPKD